MVLLNLNKQLIVNLYDDNDQNHTVMCFHKTNQK